MVWFTKSLPDDWSHSSRRLSDRLSNHRMASRDLRESISSWNNSTESDSNCIFIDDPQLSSTRESPVIKLFYPQRSSFSAEKAYRKFAFKFACKLISRTASERIPWFGLNGCSNMGLWFRLDARTGTDTINQSSSESRFQAWTWGFIICQPVRLSNCNPSIAHHPPEILLTLWALCARDCSTPRQPTDLKCALFLF